MNGKSKAAHHQEQKGQKRQEAKRKAKVHKNQVLAFCHPTNLIL